MKKYSVGCKNLTDDIQRWTKHLIINNDLSKHSNLKYLRSLEGANHLPWGNGLQKKKVVRIENRNK
jgi:hypothetical protein